MKVCDYLIVGAGATGCVVAGRLSEDPANRVIIVEAGGPDRHPFLKVPSLGIFATTLSEHNWDYETGPMPAMNNRPLRLAQGRGIGGSSSVNGMLYTRGHARDYDHWRDDLGCEGWGYDDVLPYFKRAERHQLGESRFHGNSGPLPIRHAKPYYPICDAYLNAAREAGYPVLDDLNANISEGFGYFDVNIGSGKRVSAATAYLKHGRKNLEILPNSPALRLLIENGRVVGAEIGQGAARETIRAEREVILSAGSLRSPQVLMLSGIGPADHLIRYGIPVVADRPEVGRNLRNNPSYKMWFSCSEPITAYKFMNPLGIASCLIRYALNRSGPLAESYVQAGGFIRTDPSFANPDIMTILAPGLVKRGESGQNRWSLLPSAHGLMVGCTLGRPDSRGTIRLRSSNPADMPEISQNLFAEPRDLHTLVRGIQKLRAMMRTPSISKITTELEPGPAAVTDDDVATDARKRCATAHHPMGACRMGGDADSVVDPELRVRGIEGLRIADTSIVPQPVCAGPYAPAIMIGEKAADMIARGTPRGEQVAAGSR